MDLCFEKADLRYENIRICVLKGEFVFVDLDFLKFEWNSDLLFIKRAIETASKTIYNSVLINYYRDGKDRVAWHSDDEKELGRNPVIASISLGAERKFKLRHKQYKQNGYKHEIVLKNGSFLLMRGETQHNWLHEIPRTALPISSRINLTFRVIQTV